MHAVAEEAATARKTRAGWGFSLTVVTLCAGALRHRAVHEFMKLVILIDAFITLVLAAPDELHNGLNPLSAMCAHCAKDAFVLLFDWLECACALLCMCISSPAPACVAAPC